MTHNHSTFKGLVTLKDDQPITTSLKISEVFEKRHHDVLRAIETLACPPEFASANFCVHVKKIQAGAVKRDSKYYEITKDGFMFLVMGFTGDKAAYWKVDFINAFNQLDALHRQQVAQQPSEADAKLLAECNHKVASIENHYQSQLIEAQQQQLHITAEAYELAKSHITLLGQTPNKNPASANPTNIHAVTHSRVQAPYRDAEIRQLKTLYHQGHTQAQIAQSLGRTLYGIEHKIRQLKQSGQLEVSHV